MSKQNEEAPVPMGLRLIEQDEVIERTYGGTTFKLRKASHGELTRLRWKHTVGGRVKERDFHEDLWRLILVGWEQLFIGKAGEEQLLEYSGDQVLRVSDALPDSIAEVLMADARGPEIKFHEALGN